MIDFIFKSPTLHIFTKGRSIIDYRDGETHFAFDLSDEEKDKLKETLNKEE